ncbi:4'-phosphopantetheinyl transferase family protein [Rhodoferax sp.]|uniref:4'-phosphopantetheinyl transferase family protein n=1 Tax=Rhodoferax sp. TaxID=50421 RepID=UPI00374D53D6
MIQHVRLSVASVAQCAAEVLQTDLQWLSESEHGRLALITASTRRSQFLAVRWLLRRALSLYTGKSDSFWALGATAAGAPVLLSHPDIHLSLSHSADWAACAVSDAAVGVDIEAPERLRDTRRLASAVYSEAELRSAEGLGPISAEQQFYRIWTLKEAWLKSHGEVLDLARLPAVHTCAAPEGEANARVWQSAGANLALVADPKAVLHSDGWADAAVSYWHVGSAAH